MNIPVRMLALISGIIGGVIGFIINVLNSSLRFVGQIVNFTDSGGHLFIGTLVAIVACVGAIIVMFAPEVGAILLLLSAVGFFFAIGWWALIPAIFLLTGAWLAMRARTQREPVPS
ncbi:MAG TPA: hypothetical protein VGP82_22980 [Ktedonobacterales bacterium]|jgi:hypothetical protein|nr:hypothetical protein [Ktedonobacterales bacterium]